MADEILESIRKIGSRLPVLEGLKHLFTGCWVFVPSRPRWAWKVTIFGWGFNLSLWGRGVNGEALLARVDSWLLSEDVVWMQEYPRAARSSAVNLKPLSTSILCAKDIVEEV